MKTYATRVEDRSYKCVCIESYRDNFIQGNHYTYDIMLPTESAMERGYTDNLYLLSSSKKSHLAQNGSQPISFGMSYEFTEDEFNYYFSDIEDWRQARIDSVLNV